jgi:hypothetical protein
MRLDLGTDKSSYQTNLTLITIRISEKVTLRKYASKISTDKNTTNYLIIAIDNNGVIQQGTIAQATPSESRENVQTSMLVGSILGNTCTAFNGTFTVMTLDRNFMYQFTYADNVRKSESALQSMQKTDIQKIRTAGIRNIADVRKALERNVYIRTDSQCYDWYWFEFWSDGSVTATYLGTECEPDPNDVPCAEAAIGGDGKLRLVTVNCYTLGGSGGGDNGNRYGMIIMNEKPAIPGNDSTVVQATYNISGAMGLFQTSEWYGSAMYKKGAGYTYTDQGGSSSIHNAGPAPYLYTTWIGAVLYDQNQSATVSRSRTGPIHKHFINIRNGKDFIFLLS